jgi:HlyD family secretion protein
LHWLIIGSILLLLAVGAGIFFATRPRNPKRETTTVTRGSIVASVVGSGNITAAQSIDLSFQLSGSVAQVLVKEGNVVTAGETLAQLDDRNLRLQVENAKANLMSARLQLKRTQAGTTTPADIAGARANVRGSEAGLVKARTGNVTAADIASSEAAVAAAQANLQATRDQLSATKTRAQQQLYQASQSLVQAQANYSQAYWNNQYVQETGNSPAQPEIRLPNGQTEGNELTDPAKLNYTTRLTQAEAALRSAEEGVAQAQVTYDNARQAEVTGIQQAEQQLAQAQAQLAKLRQGGTKADMAAAQASIDQAQANLKKLTEPASETDVALQQANVAQAENALEQARLNLDQATLRAPFGGVITAVSIVPGSIVSPNKPAISLVDRSTLYMDLRLSETDVAQIQLGQPVTMTINALPGWQAKGTITYIAPAAENVSGVVTYQVRASFPDTEARVKVGMTASLTIVTARKDNVLLVPNSALLPKGAGRVVQVVDLDGQIRETPVETGLTDGKQTEVIRGLQAGDRVVTVPLITPPSSGSFLNLGR